MNDRRSREQQRKKGRSSSRVRDAEEVESGTNAEAVEVLLKTNRLLVQALATLAMAEDMPVEVYHEAPYDGSTVRVEVQLLKENLGAISCSMPFDELFMNTDMCEEDDNSNGGAAPYVATLLSRRNLIKFISQGKRRRERKKAPRKSRTRAPEPEAPTYEVVQDSDEEGDEQAREEVMIDYEEMTTPGQPMVPIDDNAESAH